MKVKKHFVTEPYPCAYLPGRQAVTEYLLVSALSAAEYEELMNRGYRKFGALIFRPACAGCKECHPLRVNAAEFKPSRGQRRTWLRNQDLEVRVGPAVADSARIKLYNRYHLAQSRSKGWEAQRTDKAAYLASFVNNPIPNTEISVWRGEVLLAVALVDITPNTVSAIYHYYAPNFPARALGTYALLQTIEFARRLAKPWVYLGYYVSGSAAMAYKARFKPCEILKQQ